MRFLQIWKISIWNSDLHHVMQEYSLSAKIKLHPLPVRRKKMLLFLPAGLFLNSSCLQMGKGCFNAIASQERKDTFQHYLLSVQNACKV